MPQSNGAADMLGIFLSYRREDSAGWADRLADLLKKRFGADELFMDIHTIEPGMDFVDALTTHLHSCAVLLAVIGPRWLTVQDPSGRLRLETPTHYVRLEIATALRRPIRVIPVLVGGAKMPTEADVPDELRMLVRRQAHEVSDTRWEYDEDRLVRTLEKVLGKAALRGPEPPARRGGVRLLHTLMLLLSGVMVAVGLGTVFSFEYPTIPIDFNLALLFMLSGALTVLAVSWAWQTIRRKKT
jgi:hypothetical protein